MPEVLVDEVDAVGAELLEGVDGGPGDEGGLVREEVVDDRDEVLLLLGVQGVELGDGVCSDLLCGGWGQGTGEVEVGKEGEEGPCERRGSCRAWTP